MVLMVISCHNLFGQEQQEFNQSEHHETPARHRFGVAIGQTYVPAGNLSEGGRSFLVVPTWALEYEYWFKERWAVGYHADVEIMNYVIKRGMDQELERESPVVMTIIGMYKIYKNLILYAGPGVELEKNENFFVYRVGLSYEIELPGHWDISPGLIYDNKQGIYDSWSLMLSVGKHF